jgi:hypothetical protein
MKILRNAYFWLFLGSILFIGLMDWASSFHISQRNADEIAAERDEPAPAVISPFWEGFVTAGVVVGAWVVVYRQQNPKPIPPGKGYVMDHEAGELLDAAALEADESKKSPTA